MTPSIFTLISLLVLAAPSPRIVKLDLSARVEQAQKLFNQGEFDAALKLLEAGGIDLSDESRVDDLHLLRAQCHAARQDFVRAEEAFALALEANPEAELDPARVDPTLVKLLESVRSRLVGPLVVNSVPPGLAIAVDGKPVGVTPQALEVPIGRRRVGMTWEDGTSSETIVHIRPRREVRVEWINRIPKATSSISKSTAPRPYADLRGAVEIPSAAGATVTGGIDLGGGFETGFFRVGLAARLFPVFGVIPRFALALPVIDRTNVVLELSVPVLFTRAANGTGAIGLGISGGGGAEYYVFDWMGFFIHIGGRHYFLWQNNAPTAFVATAGVRLRIP